MLADRPQDDILDDVTHQPLGELVTAEPDAERVALNIPLGRYTLLREVNHGGMGAVYEAQQHEPQRVVAIKLMRTALSSRSARQRFMREVQVLAGLSHPHIAQLLDAGVWHQGIAQIPFYAMEMIRGATPITAFADASELNIAQRMRLFLSVCDAVQHAHDRRVLHCDLKPANILVSAEGHVKVVDFGVARLIGAKRGDKTLYSDASLLMGTPQYMSPEQVGDQGDRLDFRSDVYELGIVLYELLCGQLPYQVSRSSIVDAARDVRRVEPARPRKLNPGLSADVETVLLKSLQKDPERRYQSVADLRRDLVHLLEGEPVDARRASRAYVVAIRASRWVARRRLFAVVLAFFLLLLALERGDTWVQLRGARRALDRFATTKVRHLPAGPFQKVVVVALRDGTDFNALAGEQGLQAFDPKDGLRSLRVLHGQLMRHLAAQHVRPRVLVWDIGFESPFEKDSEFADGAVALRSAGTPVVCSVGTWPTSPAASTTLSPQIAAAVSACGCSTGGFKEDGPWTIRLAHRFESQPAVPSLALAAAAQYWQPHSLPGVEFGLDSVVLQYPPSAVAPGSARTIDVTTVDDATRENADLGLHKGDTLAQYIVEVPRDPDLATSTIGYDEVFHVPADQLRAMLGDKIVIVGDFRAGRDGPHRTPDGRSLPACVAVAAATEALVNNTPILWPRLVSIGGATINAQFIADGGALALGFAVGLALSKRHLTRLVSEFVLAGSSIALAIAIYRSTGHLFMPLVAFMAVVVGGEVVAAIWRARPTALA